MLTAGTYLAAFVKGDSVDNLYKELKGEFEEVVGKSMKRRAEIKAIMKENHLLFPGDAAKILNERQAVASVGSDESPVTNPKE